MAYSDNLEHRKSPPFLDKLEVKSILRLIICCKFILWFHSLRGFLEGTINSKNIEHRKVENRIRESWQSNPETFITNWSFLRLRFFLLASRLLLVPIPTLITSRAILGPCWEFWMSRTARIGWRALVKKCVQKDRIHKRRENGEEKSVIEMMFGIIEVFIFR